MVMNLKISENVDQVAVDKYLEIVNQLISDMNSFTKTARYAAVNHTQALISRRQGVALIKSLKAFKRLSLSHDKIIRENRKLTKNKEL